MAEYPAHEESDVVLKDGTTVHLRPIKPEDAPRLLELYHHLSEESLYFRFFSLPPPDPGKAAYLATVDYENQFALVAEVGGRIAGVARYYRDAAHADRAEAAFTVADDFQGHGLGTKMLERLAEIAYGHGIRVFEADVLSENKKMIDVFGSSGFKTFFQAERGVLHGELFLTPTPDLVARIASRKRRAAAASMRLFFEPKTVAVVGANRKRGQIGAEVLHNLKATGFTGRLYAVNPNAGEIEGTPSFRSVRDIPDDVHLAVICVPAAFVETAVNDCLEKGVRALVVISAGFGETGEEGREREARLLEKVRAAGARMVGPNCMGLLNTDPTVHLNATFAPVYPPEGRVAMSSQSGALGLAILDYARQLNIGFSTFVSIGNKADVSGNDLIQYWAEDPRTDVILLYLESFGNPRKFGELARQITRQKPILCVKSGRSRAGRRAASSHTGALASSDAVVEALFRHAGIIRAETLAELFDAANLLAHQPLPAGRRVALLTNAGGPAILAADACERAGLEVSDLSPGTGAALRAFLPAAASVANPVDMLAGAGAEHYARAMGALLADERVDSLLVIFIPPIPSAAESVAAAILEGARGAKGKPVLAIFMSAHGTPPILKPIPCYPFPESAAIALAKVTDYAERRRRPEGTIPPLAIDAAAARGILESALVRGEGWLTPEEAFTLLSAAAIPMARTHVAHTAGAAILAAGRIGYPVAVKAVGAKLIHKTDVGGVRLNLGSPTAVKRAFSEMKRRLGDDLEGVSVQEMVPGGAELMAGAVHDAVFGPVVACGSGGVTVELMGDVAFRIHPLTDRDAAEMLDEVKASALLRGFRGTPPLDAQAFRELLLGVSALLTLCPEISEMDFNPVKVLESGAKVVDARVRVEQRPRPAPSRRISY